MLDDVFTAVPLRCISDARKAYALVTLVHPQISARRWDDFARRYGRIRRDRGGLIAIQDRRRYIHAVFRYVLDLSPSMGVGNLLRMQDVIIAQMVGRPLVPAIAACAEHIAADLGCSAIALEMPAQGAARDTLLLRAIGFSMTGATMMRPFGP